MCYSGRCRWENYMGDCKFPHNDVVREKYPIPVCEIPTCKEECTTEHIKYLNYIYNDIQKILKNKKRLYKIKKVLNFIQNLSTIKN